MFLKMSRKSRWKVLFKCNIWLFLQQYHHRKAILSLFARQVHIII